MRQCVITDGQGTTAVILPEKGATVVSLKTEGYEALYQNEENLLSPERPRCGIPFLFPAFGRFEGDVFRHKGVEYPMEIHGFAHISQWDVELEEENHLRLVLRANEQTLQHYPFQFRVTLDFTLENGMLEIRQTYENLDSEPMPYGLGFHPYWKGDPEEFSADVMADCRIDRLTEAAEPFSQGNVQVAFVPGAWETGYFFTGAREHVQIHCPDGLHQIRMEFDESFDQLVFWTWIGQKFLCIEPINGVPNGLNTGNCLYLKPGEVKQARLAVKILCNF